MARKKLQVWGNKGTETTSSRFFNTIVDKYGHSVLYRRYSVGTQSEWYSETTGAGVGGPKWTYTDEVAKVRHDPMSIRGAIGTTVQKSKFYLDRTVKPKRGDVIIELDVNDPDPSEHDLYTAQHREAFEIDDVDVKRGVRGMIAYYIVSVVPHL